MYDFQDLNSLVHPLSAHHFTSSYFFRPPEEARLWQSLQKRDPKNVMTQFFLQQEVTLTLQTKLYTCPVVLCNHA